jgi:chemotaxis protein methyltransferase CheR
VFENLDDATFEQFAGLIYNRAGIRLGPHKRALVCSRLGKRMRCLGVEDYQRYFEIVQQDRTESELVCLLDAISTNVTNFYREGRHFEVLSELIAYWQGQGQNRFRLWSAAASTGEEPYTMAMVLSETLADLSETKVLATDLSTQVLERARKGVYEPRQVEKVPVQLRGKYFFKSGRGEDCEYQVGDRLKGLITFARLNLSEPPFPMHGPLDVIFCRNVMIYFDNPVRKRLLNELYRLLRPGGYLMVGHAESLSGMLSSFKSVAPSIYIKPD